ncbi:MAG TPA: FAD-dependent oxidoreductase [bacterium]|nr:FAD-dependent oxidoreductase [bacterium]HOL34950.1 FAD-dependent oxidoreductase [bacterium]HPP09107.1 FAD-dependent oxidoreductase [bacterium]
MEEKELVIIGGGPAGLCAAIEARKKGIGVLLIDENLKPGGQLFKQIHRFFGSRQHMAGIRGITIGETLLKEVEKVETDVWLDSVAYGIFRNRIIGVVKNGKNILVRAKTILVAAGALENPLPFPGWTLPGVMGAGACQTMVNIHRVLPGKKALIIGAGNVGLIVAYQLIQAGAEIKAVIDIMPEITGYMVHAAKIKRSGVPIFLSTTVLEAIGKKEVKAAVICPVDNNFKPIYKKRKLLDVDLICIAVGLSPLNELLYQADCEFTYKPYLGGRLALHNENMETTVDGIFVAGDCSGIEEASTAMEEGKLAGISAAEKIRKKQWDDEKLDIRNRLNDFRIGTFGEKRKISKEEIIREYHERIKT